MKKALTILILLISVSFMSGQTLYYVDGANGTDDGAHGTASGTDAWASIQYAITNVSDPATATIVINVAAGTYTESVTIDRNFKSLAIVGASVSTTIVQAHASPNTATSGVFAIYGDSGNLNDETVSLQNFTIRNGVVFSGSPPNVNYGGGGILNNFASLNVQNCNITNCTGDFGGGIYNAGVLNIINSTLNNNSAYTGGHGGAIFTTHSAEITNCTFSNNNAISGYGGGMSMRGSTILTNCTIANNNSTYGAGIYLDQGATIMTIKNTIVANNSSTNNIYAYDGEITNNGYNIVETWYGHGSSTFNFTNGVNGCHVGDGDYGVSSTLADNSTLNGTYTLALSAGSVAINAGDATANGSVSIPSTDQRGAFRSGTVDIGAFEYEGAVPVELTSFTAILVDESVVLNWTTATEVNNYGFEVERVLENYNWEVIGFVEGHGNSNSPKDYSFVDNSVSGNSSYRLKQIDTDGAFEYSDVVKVSLELSKEFSIAQNYPNPFNPTTSISFTLPVNGFVTLKIYNTIGEEVAELLNKNIESGNHNVIFNASNLPTGAYFYRITAENYSETKKMLLIK